MNLIIIRIKKIFFLLSNPKFLKLFFKYKVVPSIEHLDNIKDLEFNNVIDVGANNGQFALLINSIFPSKKIYLFEPNKECINNLEAIFYLKKNIYKYYFALGQKKMIGELYVTKSNDSSSLLRPALIKDLYNSAQHKSSTKINIESGDFLNNSIILNSLLKIDVQGFELEVLKGFKEKLQKFKYILVELSYIELYEKQALFDDVDIYLRKMDFTLKEKYNLTKKNNNSIQSDFIYENKKNKIL